MPDTPKAFPRGIKTWHEPRVPDVDIVFVHGLTGDRDRTWCVPGGAPWPQVDLSRDLPNARILTFGYDAYISNWKHVVSGNRLGSHAKNLLNDLAAYRTNRTQDLPIIFVAHSLGGLVVKDALVTAWRGEEAHVQKILEATRAIAFLGTPHAGSGLAKWAERSFRILGLFKQANPEILSTLRQDSEVLSRVHDDFAKLLRLRAKNGQEGEIAVTCFYEELPMPVIGFVVPMESAVIPGYPQISIYGNHRDMVRFLNSKVSDSESGCKSIVSELERWTSTIVSPRQPLSIAEEQGPRNSGSLEVSTSDTDYSPAPLTSGKGNFPALVQPSQLSGLENDCLHALAFPGMDNRRLAIDDPAEDTCTWIYDHPVYHEWYSRSALEKSQGLLWIKGKPGSGKSTIMKRLLDRSLANNGNSRICLAFFFSARGADTGRSAYWMYRSLTHQLVWRSQECLQKLTTTLFEAKTRRFGKVNFDWNITELRNFFHSAITQAGLEPIVIYVDALDECNDEDVRNIVAAFEHSAAVAIENGANVNICWSSRHYPHIKVSKSLELRMESQNAADIALYVHNALKDRNAKTSDFDLEGEIVRKANGVFLWVILVIHRLWNAADYEQTSKEKMHILKQIPSELDGMFSLILDTVEEKRRHETLLFFQWILLASHPLTLKEFRYAIAFSSERPPSSIKSLKESDVFVQGDKALASLIRDRSGGLLEVTQAVIDNTVQFIHESVRDFLISGTGLGILGLTGRDDFARGGHEHLKRACIAFLRIDELRTVPSVRLMGSRIHKLISKISNASNRLESLQDQGKPNDFRTAQAALSKPFARYAIQNWVFHAYSAELAGESQASLLHWARLRSFERWITLADTNERANLGVWMREATDLQSKEILFHIACEMGLHTCIAPLIENGVDPLCKVRDEARGPLVAAANGHDAVILELLDHGLAVETVWSCAVRNVLHEAVFAGHLQVVRLLIRHGIDLELWTGGGETALYVATSRNDESIVRALLDAGAMVNGITSDGSTPLHSAADQGTADMVEALIDAGAEINARSAAGLTPLQLAARRNWVPGCDQVISVLIEAGADLDGQSEEMLRMKWLSMDEIELSTPSDHSGD